MGKSGSAARDLLQKYGAQVACFDEAASSNTVTSPDELSQLDFLVSSPGVPPFSEFLNRVKEAEIPIIDEIELSYRLCNQLIIAVTGSNGKTTVTQMIVHALRRLGYIAEACGNIGTPLAQLLAHNEDTPEFFVQEVSSFQLSRTFRYRPKVAVALNLSPNHLDWHESLEDYALAKAKILQNHSFDNVAVLNRSDQWSQSLSEDYLGQIVWFDGDQESCNEAAALAAIQGLGIDVPDGLDLFEDFERDNHRRDMLEPVEGVSWINDSKSTNPASTFFAVEQVKQRLVLILGGKNKGLDFTSLTKIPRTKIKCVIAFGEAAPAIKNDLQREFVVHETENLEQSVTMAHAEAEKGDSVLFSPACASFDQYKNYERRGEHFIRLVDKLRKEKVDRLAYKRGV